MKPNRMDKQPRIASSSAANARSRWKTAWYASVWRWHFYAGLIFAPFIIILAVSGSVYLFKPQIEGYLYKDMLTVREVGAAALPADEIVARTMRAYPGTSVSSVTYSDDPAATLKLGASRDGIFQTLYADPYTGHIRGILDNDHTFSAFFKKMHSELVIGGTWANRLVELAACWALILTLTGLCLWWPRNKSALWGTILPRLSKPGSRQFWRDLHAVPAFWLSVGIVVLILTGLPWSGVMGQQINKVATATHTDYPPYALSFAAKPNSVTVTKDVSEDVPWAAEQLPVPESVAGGYVRLAVEEVSGIAERHQVARPYTISMPHGERGVYTIATSHSRPGDNATLHVDQYSGAVLTDVRYADYGWMAKAITLGIALHEGQLFGIVNQLLGLIVALGLILISISSYVMWQKRKPAGKLGAPPRPKDKRATLGVLAIMIVCGLIMPLVGLSLIVVLALDLLLLRRIERLRHWFG
ncbi:hypothetical protein PA598K_06242 [Paenibacillus sp. 598K]|uniref:PepSY-associated TM helix domain-containing protein n=1 Tax=Paenibacillus sp. 598K TaxID=1117987 RepID=UPI000FF9C3C7|nr:PepSY domain-containing protein [Paenibacillus sp. 598K]GBF77680.1 hypothetical protein PA598K_06242 [Paenibacillus sp. 598K]